MNITPIPDREASGKLNVTYETIRNAVKRGDLTRIPQAGLIQHVAEEQAMLFEGMSRIVREKLSPDKLKKWHEIDDTITRSYTHRNLQDDVRAAPITIGSFNFPDKETTQYMHQNNLAMDMNPTPAGGMSFQSAQPDKADSKTAEYSISWEAALTILVGLLALFFVLRALKKEQELEEARNQAEKELHEIGLQKENLERNRARSIIELQRHPKHAQRMQKIVENAVLLEDTGS